MKNKIILILIYISIVKTGFAQLAPKYSNDFLTIGVSARALGLANSVVTSTNDANAGYWNPAGLINQPFEYSVAMMHAEYFAGMSKYDFAAGSYKQNDSSVFAVSFIRMAWDDIPNTLNAFDANGNLNTDNITTFSVADYALLLSYARKSKIKGLNYGATAKIIYRQEGSFATAFGFGFDAGLIYSKNNWKFALVAKDVTTTFNSWMFNTSQLTAVFDATGNVIPKNSTEITLPSFIGGVARSFTYKDNYHLLAEFNFNLTLDGKRNTLVSTKLLSVDPHAGIEIDFRKMIFFRMGVGNIQQITDFGNQKSWDVQPNVGLGLCLYNYTLDYALTDLSGLSGTMYSNVFSLSYSFAKQRK